MEKLFRKLEKDLQEIWDYAFGKDVVPDIRYCLKMYQMLADYWERLIKDKNGTIYSLGYDMICTSLGNMYLMFDTDIPEQDDIIYRLLELIKINENTPAIKTLINEMRLNKIQEDF